MALTEEIIYFILIPKPCSHSVLVPPKAVKQVSPAFTREGKEMSVSEDHGTLCSGVLCDDLNQFGHRNHRFVLSGMKQ